MVRQTSLEAYNAIRGEGITGVMQSMVLKGIIKYGPCTDLELAKAMHLPDPNSIRPRRNELVRLGKVEERGKRRCDVSGRMAMIWGIKQ